jgi:hypothetical protein
MSQSQSQVFVKSGRLPVDQHPNPLKRVAKRWIRDCVWRWPALYRWVFEMRHNGRDQFRSDGAFWVVGFQRSGNTFAGLLLDEVLFPGRVDFHLHIASSLRVAVDSGRPGFLVIRKPLDAAISVAIFHQWPLLQALEDYIDIHRFWLRDVDVRRVPVAPFEWFTSHPGALVAAAARLMDLPLTSDPVTPAVLERIRVRTEGMFMATDGSLNECQVARPSVFRSELQRDLKAAANGSPRIQRLLATAESIRQEFLAHAIPEALGNPVESEGVVPRLSKSLPS